MSNHRGYIATTHAVKRYWQRIEKCSKRDAIDRLQHAAKISRMASSRQVAFCRRNKRIIHGGGMYLWCEIESLLLICERVADAVLILTVFRVPSDKELRDANWKPPMGKTRTDQSKRGNRRERESKTGQRVQTKQFVW